MKRYRLKSSRSPARTRAGILLPELILSLILLGATISFLVPSLGALQRLNRGIQQQAVLQESAANIIEILHTLPRPVFDEVTRLESAVQDHIEINKLSVKFQIFPAEPADQPWRILVEVAHKEQATMADDPSAKPLQLVTWRTFSEGGGES